MSGFGHERRKLLKKKPKSKKDISLGLFFVKIIDIF
jgi:hypothetical protein